MPTVPLRDRRPWRLLRAALMALGFVVALAGLVSTASDLFGEVAIGDVPVPGATVTATQGETRLSTVTDAQGIYRFTALADGVWSIRVEMLGFEPRTLDVTTPRSDAVPAFALALLPFDEITRGLVIASRGPTNSATAPRAPNGREPGTVHPGPPAPGGPGTLPRGFSPADVRPIQTASPPPTAEPEDDNTSAANGFVVNGSVLNGAASPFAQLRAFGNRRSGQRSLYTGGIALNTGTSAWDARPYSFAAADTSKPSYRNLRWAGNVGGPLRVPRLFGNGLSRPTFYLGLQHTSDTTANSTSAVLPDARQRVGDFSHTLDGAGRPIRLVDPLTGEEIHGGVISLHRISPQAQALLNYYPMPNIDADTGPNYQVPVITDRQLDSVQLRLQHAVRRELFAGSFNYQRATTTVGNVFDFADVTRNSGFDMQTNWTHRLSPFFSFRARYQITALTDRTTPYFADRINVSGLAGIDGNNQESANWGPPALTFSSGFAGLSDGQPNDTRSRTNLWNGELYWSHGRHYVTIGGETRHLAVDIHSQQDPRGSFVFTGALTGLDFADFLLGLPSASAIATGNADKFLRGWQQAAYLSDDWRVSPVLTVNAGLRWDYESPLTERFDRLVNLDVLSGFREASPVLASHPTGTTTGTRYPRSLLRGDYRGVQPRVGVSWRPVPGSSLVVRGGYGIYRNTNVYQAIATQIAQQPPLSKTFTAETNATAPLTLANGFTAPSRAASNTFGVDPDFRVGYAHNWSVSLQRDLPMSLTTTVTYLGTQGRHLLQEFLPNTYPAGAVNPCPSCPSGFVYLTSGGHSSRHAGQFQLRRRLRNGLSASAQYTLSVSRDNASGFTTANTNLLSSVSIAQNWLDLDAEWGRSAFDERHRLVVQAEYTTGVGTTGGAFLGGRTGTLLRNWTISANLTTGSGTPLTPLVLRPVRGTGITGTIRPSLTGVANTPAAGAYLNPAAFALPATGTWGTAGRNSIAGPGTFSLNAGLSRTFPWGARTSLDWRLDVTNVLNTVTYSTIGTIVGSPQFGLPVRANAMRQLQASARLRF